MKALANTISHTLHAHTSAIVKSKWRKLFVRRALARQPHLPADAHLDSSREHNIKEENELSSLPTGIEYFDFSFLEE